MKYKAIIRAAYAILKSTSFEFDKGSAHSGFKVLSRYAAGVEDLEIGLRTMVKSKQ